MQFLDWFVKEQGEEEDNANDLISKMELFGSDPKSLYMLNSELAGRVYNAPSLVLSALVKTKKARPGGNSSGPRFHRVHGFTCPAWHCTSPGISRFQ